MEVKVYHTGLQRPVAQGPLAQGEAGGHAVRMFRQLCGSPCRKERSLLPADGNGSPWQWVLQPQAGFTLLITNS